MSRPAPLAGVRVLDLTRLLPGPVCTLHLADLGADVIKIEDPQVGDYARQAAPGQPDSAYFRMINRNKRGLQLDLKKPAAITVLLNLVRTADVIVESFRPGVMARLGLDYARLAAHNPRLVYCSISGYGQDGPYRECAGHDINYLGYAGVLEQIGAADGAPAIPNFQIADLLGGAMTAAMGILAGVIDARHSGQGRYLDIAMTDSVLVHNYFALLRLGESGASAARGRDVLSGGLPCYATYRCADGAYMAVGALEPGFWHSCCQVLERPEWRGRQWDAALKAEMATLFATRSRAEWVQRFAAVDCSVSPVLTPEEAFAGEQAKARGLLLEEAGLPQFAPPLKVSEFTFKVRHAAPARDQHTTEILEAAGYSPADIAELRATGTLG